jgi:hypothetical protein
VRDAGYEHQGMSGDGVHGGALLRGHTETGLPPAASQQCEGRGHMELQAADEERAGCVRGTGRGADGVARWCGFQQEVASPCARVHHGTEFNMTCSTDERARGWGWDGAGDHSHEISTMKASALGVTK